MRLLECVTLAPESGRELGSRRYYVGGRLVSNHVYSLKWLELHKAGRLGEPRTQSTGFGYRIVTDAPAIRRKSKP
jgi:hypothetical protein